MDELEIPAWTQFELDIDEDVIETEGGVFYVQTEGSSANFPIPIKRIPHLCKVIEKALKNPDSVKKTDRFNGKYQFYVDINKPSRTDAVSVKCPICKCKIRNSEMQAKTGINGANKPFGGGSLKWMFVHKDCLNEFERLRKLAWSKADEEILKDCFS